ncbi:MAG: acetyltransferase [Nostocales cyanobacterium 94392]|nr:acetyltransferase [Nostocales cyanobacterium 94392]
MFLQLKDDGELVKVTDVQQLINPNTDSIEAKQQQGEEEQPSESFKKENLVFPSGESLPRCWMDADYKNG